MAYFQMVADQSFPFFLWIVESVKHGNINKDSSGDMNGIQVRQTMRTSQLMSNFSRPSIDRPNGNIRVLKKGQDLLTLIFGQAGEPATC